MKEFNIIPPADDNNSINSIHKDSQPFNVPTPKEIMAYLNERVVGQDYAKKYPAIAIYNHYKRISMSDNKDKFVGTGLENVNVDKSNMLIMGHTGTGKTYTVKMIAKMLDVPCYIADATKLTQAGYVGDDVETICAGLYREANGDLELAQRGVICIDKIARKGENVSITRDVSGEGVQQSLLKIVEGNVVGFNHNDARKHPDKPQIFMDTTNVPFIGMGAFEDIEPIIERRIPAKSTVGFKSYAKETSTDNTDNLLERVTPSGLHTFGLMPEFIGRFPVAAHTNPLTKDDLVRILKVPHDSIIKQFRKPLKVDDIDLVINDDVLELIADIAVDNNTGARGLRGVMETLLMDVMFDFADHKANAVHYRLGLCKDSIV